MITIELRHLLEKTIKNVKKKLWTYKSVLTELNTETELTAKAATVLWSCGMRK